MPVQAIIEKILLSTYALKPWFWSKKKCESLNNTVYQSNTRLYQCLMAIKKKYGLETLQAVSRSWDAKKLRILAKAAKYNQRGDIMMTLHYCCEQEVEKQKRLSAPKDCGDPKPLSFDPGSDLRNNKVTKKLTLWEFLNGKEKEGGGD